MHYVIDAREAFGKQKTGKGQWTIGFIEELVRQNKQLTLLTTQNSVVPEEFAQKVGILRSGSMFHYDACKYMQQTSSAVYISPTSFIVPAILHYFTKNLVYTIVHDMIAFRAGKHDKKARFIEKLFLRQALKHSTRIGCVSSATKDELLSKFTFLTDKDVRVIHAGPMNNKAKKSRNDENFLLCAGTLCPRKNQLRLLQAYAGLPDDIQAKHSLVLVGGRGWADEEIVKLAKFLPNVEWKGYVSDEEYQQYLEHCYALVYPSEYEGFGLQVLDALSKGVPVLTSQGGSLEEVVSTAGLIVDPFSIQSITAGLLELCTNTNLHKQLQKAGPIQASTFTWQKTVDTLL